MSNNPPGDQQDRNWFHRKVDQAFVESSKLAGSNLAPGDFYQQFLSTAIASINAPAGVIWLRTPMGFLQVINHINLDQIGLDEKRGGRECHNELLRQIFQSNPPQPVIVEPQGRLQIQGAQPAAIPAANLTNYYAILAPILGADRQPMGLLEIFQEATHDVRLYQAFLQYAVQMAGYASQYHAFAVNRQNSGTEKIFTQIEAYARLIHGTLNPTECAYHVANEGRRLVESDRLCVAIRHGRGATVEAVSGADVVEKASTHTRRMRKLFDEVLKFNDQLIFDGSRDEALPPALLQALDDYLAESQPKLLVVTPIRDEREKDETKPARSALLMECFNPPEQTEAMVQRLDVVGKHAAPALYNASELKRIPLGWVWKPVLALQEGLGGRKRFILFAVLATIIALSVLMVFVPYPLKMDAKGEFMPFQVKQAYAPYQGEVWELMVKPGQTNIKPGDPVVKMYSADLAQKLTELDGKIETARKLEEGYRQQLDNKKPETNEADVRTRLVQAEVDRNSSFRMRENLVNTFNLIDTEPGFYLSRAPKTDLINGLDPGSYTVLNSDNREKLNQKTVERNEPLVRLGAVNGPWRGELKIPQRNIGHIMRAFVQEGYHQTEQVPDPTNPARMITKKYLPVDVLFAGSESSSYPGKLYESDVAAEAVPNVDDRNESQPVVIAYVQMDLKDLTENQKKALFVAGIEIRTKIRCGDRALGYSLFHGVYEWFYENVIFYF